MIEFSNGILIDVTDKNEKIKCLQQSFVKTSDYVNLMWNAFKHKPLLITFEEAKGLPITHSKKIYFYLERQNKLYLTYYSKICDYVENLEPWEEIDGYVFDESYEWIIAITHEDNKSLIIGLDI